MKSRCAPMSAEDRQAHHLFISHHCRITARWLRRLVGSLCSAWHHLAPSRNPPYRPKPSLFPSRIRPIGRISPICLPDTRFPETSALTSSPETLAFPSYSSYWSYQSYMSFRYPLSSRNSLLFRNLCPFLLVLPLLPIRNPISSRNSECPFHQRETWSIPMLLRNLAVALASPET